jgi:hypothetical protein
MLRHQVSTWRENFGFQFFHRLKLEKFNLMIYEQRFQEVSLARVNHCQKSF